MPPRVNQQETQQESMPLYFYHATPSVNARSIALRGLQPRSVGGAGPYLCMSGIESGATTLGRAASDIIFRVASWNLDRASWQRVGAGLNEWRSTAAIPPQGLEFRRYLGSVEQQRWRPASEYSQTAANW